MMQKIKNKKSQQYSSCIHRRKICRITIIVGGAVYIVILNATQNNPMNSDLLRVPWKNNMVMVARMPMKIIPITNHKTIFFPLKLTQKKKT